MNPDGQDVRASPRNDLEVGDDAWLDPVGDLNLQTADEVWNGRAYRDLRRSFFEQGIGTACGSCSRILD